MLLGLALWCDPMVGVPEAFLILLPKTPYETLDMLLGSFPPVSSLSFLRPFLLQSVESMLLRLCTRLRLLVLQLLLPSAILCVVSDWP